MIELSGPGHHTRLFHGEVRVEEFPPGVVTFTKWGPVRRGWDRTKLLRSA